MIHILKELLPNFSHFEEHPIIDEQGEVLGFESVLMSGDRFPFAGGTASDLNSARRICAAEAIERSHFVRLIKSDLKNSDSFLLSVHPTTCGFAAGFEKQSTIFRAVAEAVERWCWSKWIDEGYICPSSEPIVKSALSRQFQSSFDKVLYFQRQIRVDDSLLPAYIPRDLIFSVVIGIKGNGVFPGSRVTTLADDCWEHPLLEAWRHLHIFENELSKKPASDIFDRRIFGFGTNGEPALKKINSADNSNWPSPKLRLLAEVASTDGYHVWRALCDDYQGWEIGDGTRFIY